MSRDHFGAAGRSGSSRIARRRVVGRQLPEGLAKLVHHHSEGNPLFMVAVLDHMIERGHVSRAGGWRLRVPLKEIALGAPEKLRRMIEAQIDRLAAKQRHALEVARRGGGLPSQQGSALRRPDIKPEEFEDLCEEISRRHHMVRSFGSEHLPDGTVSARYEFVHALYREVLYRRLASGRRAKLHQRIGEQLEYSSRIV